MQRAPRSLPALLTRGLFPEDPSEPLGISLLPWDWSDSLDLLPESAGGGEPSQTQSFHTWVLDSRVDYFPLHLVALFVE